ncbi:MAG: sugar transferase [bacterium]|nr:sugar transferase [bacterium]
MSKELAVKPLIREEIAYYMKSFRENGGWLFLKRGIDVVVSSLGLILLSPFLPIIAIIIKLDSKGPALFRQQRVGKDGTTFTMYKFRTMRVDAEFGSGPVWAKKNDARVTKIGGYLRTSRVDELPQLVNVLKGEMTLVGPRPERPVFVNEFKHIIPEYKSRLKVKPGITGLAQVRYRYDSSICDVKRKLRYDLLYIKRMCLMLDLKILFETCGVVLTGKGAH